MLLWSNFSFYGSPSLTAKFHVYFAPGVQISSVRVPKNTWWLLPAGSNCATFEVRGRERNCKCASRVALCCSTLYVPSLPVTYLYTLRGLWILIIFYLVGVIKKTFIPSLLARSASIAAIAAASTQFHLLSTFFRRHRGILFHLRRCHFNFQTSGNGIGTLVQFLFLAPVFIEECQ